MGAITKYTGRRSEARIFGSLKRKAPREKERAGTGDMVLLRGLLQRLI